MASLKSDVSKKCTPSQTIEARSIFEVPAKQGHFVRLPTKLTVFESSAGFSKHQRMDGPQQNFSKIPKCLDTSMQTKRKPNSDGTYGWGARQYIMTRVEGPKDSICNIG